MRPRRSLRSTPDCSDEMMICGELATDAGHGRRRRTRNMAIDWLAVERDYQTGQLPLRAIGEKHVDLASAVSAELQVRAARVSQVILRVGDGRTGLGVGLALYTDTGGRELEVLALRRLADALSASELAAAAAVSSLLVEQLRAEARGAGLEERPLYAAVRLVRDAGRGPLSTLSDAEVAGLLD